MHIDRTHDTTGPFVIAVVLLWGIAVIAGAITGFFSSLYPPLIAALVAGTIVLPTVWYFRSPRMKTLVDRIGHRRILLFHTWRVPAALLFFWYGVAGDLPPVFWILAGTGDLIAGGYAAYLLTRPERAESLISFHRFGFGDFIVAVGTGLTHTLLLDPLMMPVTVLPLALVVLFGVGISGASHLMAFDMLRRGSGMQGAQPIEAQLHARTAR